MIMARQYEPFVIPCKPTSPKIKVELINENGEVNVTSYNETIGFTVVSDTATTISIHCEFSLNGTVHPNYFDIYINRRFSAF
jgi:hypothetical protein